MLDRVLEYYDGPRLLLQKSRAGQFYLAWWSDTDEITDRWIYLPLSESRLHAVLSGSISVVDALKDPEDGSLLVIDKDTATDEITNVVHTEFESVPSNRRPRPGSRLNIPIPEEVSGIPTRDRTHLVDVRLESEQSDQTGRVSVKVVGEFLSSFQKLFDSIVQAKRGRVTTTGAIPASIRSESRFDIIGSYTGSVGILLESHRPDGLIDDSLVHRGMTAMFELMNAGDDPARLSGQLAELKSRVVKNYNGFLGTIENSSSKVTIYWSQPTRAETRQMVISQESARATRKVIALIDKTLTVTEENFPTDYEFEMEGVLVAGSVRARLK